MKKILSVFLACMLLSVCTLAAPKAADTFDSTAEDAVVDNGVYFEEAGLEAEADYGELIVNLDFESQTAGSNVALVDGEYPGKTNPNVPSELKDLILTGKAGTVATDENGNNYRYYKTTSTYAQTFIQRSSGGAFPQGTYTFSYDVKVISRGEGNDTAKSVFFGMNGLSNRLDTYNGSGYINLFNNGDNANIFVQGKTNASKTFTNLDYLITDNSGKYGNECYIDNIKIWYEDGKYAVNFNDGGMGAECTSIANNIRVAKGSAITLSDYKAESKSVEFLGWGLEPFGNVIDGATFTPTEDTTLYAIWDYGTKIIDLNFESSEIGSQLGTAYADAYYPAKGYASFDDMCIQYSGVSSAKSAVKAEDNGNKYIAMQTGTQYNFLKFRNNEGFPEGTYTFAYLVKMDDYVGTSGTVDFNDMCSWGNNGYETQMKKLSGNIPAGVVKFSGNDSEWKAYRVTASTLDGQLPNNFITLITDNVATKGSTFGLDNVVIYYNAPKKEYTPEVTVNAYDYRKGQFDITLGENVGIPADKAYELFFKTTGVFDAACTLTENEDGTVTYSFYEEKVYKDSSVTLNSVITYKTAEKNISVTLPEGVAGKTYTFDSVPEDGENLVPNGDVSNPYFIPFTGLASEFKPVTISDGAFNLELKDNLETYYCWLSVVSKQIDFEANTNYYIDIDMDFVKQPSLSDGTPNPYKAGKYDYFYVYIPDTKFAATENTYKVRPEYIKGMTTKNNFHASIDSLGIDQGNYRTVLKTDAALEDPAVTLQLDLNGGKSLFADTKANSRVTGAGGLGFVLKNFTIKKMYNVNLEVNGEVVETRLAAKDVTIYLPETATVSGIDTLIGWTDGEKVYDLGGEYTLAAAGDVTLTAVVQGVAPKSINKNSIRLSDPQGIRFMSAVTNKVKADEKTAEYGFIVTLESLLGDYSADYLTFEQTDVKYVTGVNYGYDANSGKDVDRIFDTDSTFTYFTAVVYGITASKENYEENIVVRPYIKYDGETIYGTPMSRSVLDVAKEIKAAGYKDLDAAGKKVITDILEICGVEA